jgi:hypothetical protein
MCKVALKLEGKESSSLSVVYCPQYHGTFVKNVTRTRTEKDDMPTQMTNSEPSADVTLLTVQREVGITRRTLKKYLAYLGIELICFHMGAQLVHFSGGNVPDDGPQTKSSSAGSPAVPGFPA